MSDLGSHGEDQESFGRLEAASVVLSADVANLSSAVTLAIKNQGKRYARTAGVLAVVIILLLSGAMWYFERAFSDYRNDRYSACEAHNTAAVRDARATREYFAPLTIEEQDEPRPDPALLKAFAELAVVQPQLSMCTK